MKLLIIITSEKNSKNLEKAFLQKKYQLTRLEGVGGFLQKKNSVFFVGVEEEKVNQAITLIKKNCQAKLEAVTGPLPITSDLEGTIIPQETTKIKVGGATVFIIDVARFVKV